MVLTVTAVTGSKGDKSVWYIDLVTDVIGCNADIINVLNVT